MQLDGIEGKAATGAATHPAYYRHTGRAPNLIKGVVYYQYITAQIQHRQPAVCMNNEPQEQPNTFWQLAMLVEILKINLIAIIKIAWSRVHLCIRKKRFNASQPVNQLSTTCRLATVICRLRRTVHISWPLCRCTYKDTSTTIARPNSTWLRKGMSRLHWCAKVVAYMCNCDGCVHGQPSKKISYLYMVIFFVMVQRWRPASPQLTTEQQCFWWTAGSTYYIHACIHVRAYCGRCGDKTSRLRCMLLCISAMHSILVVMMRPNV